MGARPCMSSKGCQETGCQAPPHRVGQRVWLSTRNLKLKLPCHKLSPKFIGPFEIVCQTLMDPRLIEYMLFLTPGELDHGSSIWWTGRGMGRGTLLDGCVRYPGPVSV
ncbi:hypothetical protein QTP86_015082 [Hemibagrus guttatus]|nr:hypothetical protein QTP86_015082 [Hemibagrus guttatus]